MNRSKTHISKRSICIFFQVHQPFRLKTYRFFNIGSDHDYYDEFHNRQIIQRIATDCYLPANEVLYSLIRKYGQAFRVTFSISGTALEQFKKYSPKVLESFRLLFNTGNVEFVAQSYAHSLAMLTQPDEYKRQVEEHMLTLNRIFGSKPTALINANMIYSNDIAAVAHKMGFRTILTEGAPQSLGWKSSNYIYADERFPEMKLLLRNYQLSDDIAFRFSMREWNKWPLTAGKFASWLNAISPKEKIVNLFMDYGTLGEIQKKETGIFSFISAFAEKILASGKWRLRTVSEAAESMEPIATLHLPEAISCAGQDHNLSAWLGNELQQEAFESLYSIAPVMQNCDNSNLLRDWNRLQTCDHFYYMSTKFLNDGAILRFFSPYNSPFDAFVNYMNVLSDFLIRVNEYVAKNRPALNWQPKHEHNQLETI